MRVFVYSLLLLVSMTIFGFPTLVGNLSFRDEIPERVVFFIQLMVQDAQRLSKRCGEDFLAPKYASKKEEDQAIHFYFVKNNRKQKRHRRRHAEAIVRSCKYLVMVYPQLFPKSDWELLTKILNVVATFPLGKQATYTQVFPLVNIIPKTRSVESKVESASERDSDSDEEFEYTLQQLASMALEDIANAKRNLPACSFSLQGTQDIR